MTTMLLRFQSGKDRLRPDPRGLGPRVRIQQRLPEPRRGVVPTNPPGR